MLLCGGFEIFRQGVELGFPENPVALDPTRGVQHGLGGEAATVDAAVDFALEQAGGFENAQVLGHRRQGNVERRGELADGGLPASQAGENSAAGGIGEGAEGGVEGSAGGEKIVNHMV